MLGPSDVSRGKVAPLRLVFVPADFAARISLIENIQRVSVTAAMPSCGPMPRMKANMTNAHRAIAISINSGQNIMPNHGIGHQSVHHIFALLAFQVAPLSREGAERVGPRLPLVTIECCYPDWRPP
jgi:hypothetical protein